MFFDKVYKIEPHFKHNGVNSHEPIVDIESFTPFTP